MTTKFLDVFSKATGVYPYPYQQRLAETSLVHSLGLQVPTASGKTASVIMAWLWQRHYHPDHQVRESTPRRLVYCLPMRVLVEQTETVAKGILERLGILNEIGLYSLMGGTVSKDWILSPEKEMILIGTQDMLLSRALNRGYASARSRWPMEFGLLNNETLWVFDEVQLMSTGLATSVQLDAFRNEPQGFGTFGNCPSLWMSATFEREWLKLVDHPHLPEKIEVIELDSEDQKNGDLRKRLEARKKLEKLDAEISKDSPKLADFIAKAHAQAQQETGIPGITLVVANTVDRARTIYNNLRAHNNLRADSHNFQGKGSDKQSSSDMHDLQPMLLLHSRFRPPDRRKLINDLFAAVNVLNAVNAINAADTLNAVDTLNSVCSGLNIDLSGDALSGDALSGDALSDDALPGDALPDTESKSFLELVRRHGLIIISTQVVEAGLDISAHILFTDLAPWASLVQRFGRCNRKGEFIEAKVYWMDLDETKSSPPYESSELKFSRDQLISLTSQTVGPRDLPKISIPLEHLVVIRRRDLMDLFDTTPDLSGNDIDISRYIRKADDLDVHILWRDLDDRNKMEVQGSPHSDEMCPVPTWDFQRFVREHSKPGKSKKLLLPYRWDFLDGEWHQCKEDEIYAGQIYLLDAEIGGYDPKEGWTGKASENLVSPFIMADMSKANIGMANIGMVDISKADISKADTTPLLPHDHYDGDNLTCTQGWKTIAEHSVEIYQELVNIIRELGKITKEIGGIPVDTLLMASRWHDRGKAHEVFLKAISLPPDTAHSQDYSHGIKDYSHDLDENHSGGLRTKADGFWAKAPKLARYVRPHFRHELASALAVLKAPEELIPESARNLVAYLVAAHHGKVRLSIRSFPGENKPEDQRLFARGIWENDYLPETDLGGGVIAPSVSLSLGITYLGRSPEGIMSWSEQMLTLRDEPTLGPFRLAFLEALLRAADQRASAQTSSSRINGKAQTSPSPLTNNQDGSHDGHE